MNHTTSEIEIKDTDTFSCHLQYCILRHPHVRFVSYRRSHFLEPSEHCTFQVVHDTNVSIQSILSSVKESMSTEIERITDKINTLSL